MNSPDFDIAISFAGEDRTTAAAIANRLHGSYGLRVFYDDYEQAKLLGECLTEYLVGIYKDRASYCAVLVSQHYVRKRWTRHEWRAAQARAFEEFDRAYVLPIRLDDSELPGLLPTTGYLSLPTLGVNRVCELIYEKVADASERDRRVRAAEAELEAGNAGRALRLTGDSRFDDYVPALRIRSGALRRLGRYLEAAKVLSKILEVEPEDFQANFLRGVCLYRAGEFEKAVLSYEQALALSPSHITVISDLAAARKWALLCRLPLIGSLVRRAVTRTVHQQAVRRRKGSPLASARS